MRETVLVLDGQTNQALATTRSLGRAGHRVLVSSHRAGALTTWSRHCHAAYRTSAETLPAFAALRAWAGRHGAGVVMPMTERSCLLCSLEREEWEARGIRVACATPDVLGLAFDKALTVELASATGLRVPRTCVPRTLAEAQDVGAAVGYPCVVKPRFSNAWDGERFLPDAGASYVADAAGLRTAVLMARQGDRWPLVQSYEEGGGKGVFALCADGEVVAWFAHERLRDVRPSGSGSSLRRSVELEERLRVPAERLLRAMRWHGPAMVEFRDDGDGEPCLMEVNGRFWGSLQLAIEAGVDFPRLWLSLLGGERPARPQPYLPGVTVRWLWGDVRRLLHVCAGPPAGYPGAFPTRRQALRELIGPQPPGTRSETWRRDDPLPAFGELFQGAGDLLRARAHRALQAPAGAAELGASAPARPPQRPADVPPFVSVIVPCRDEAPYIEPCLDSILGCDFPADRLEVLVVDGMSTDGTREKVEERARIHPRVRLLTNPRRTAPAAMNIGLAAARGEIIMRMDAHVLYPPHYVSALVRGIEESGADNVGGVITTLPAGEGAVARAIAVGLSHGLGVGNSYFRVGSSTRRYVDTVAFGCYRREVFARIGLFDEELVRNQDDEFNFRLVRSGGRILLMPEVVSQYYARGTLRQVARMFYQYGYFKPLVAQKVGRVMTARQLVPAAFILALVGSAVVAALLPAGALLLGAVVGSYAAVVLAASLALVRRHGIRCAAALALVFPVLHLSYGSGFLLRLGETIVGRRRTATDPAALPLSR